MIETKMGGDKDDADATKAKRGYRAWCVDSMPAAEAVWSR
jgi:hypothetical protein